MEIQCKYSENTAKIQFGNTVRILAFLSESYGNPLKILKKSFSSSVGIPMGNYVGILLDSWQYYGDRLVVLLKFSANVVGNTMRFMREVFRVPERLL